MRNVPQAMTDAWLAQAKTGNQRPVVRATIQQAWHNKFEYDTALAEGGDPDGVDEHRKGIFSSVIFGSAAPAREIRNIKRYSWNRSVDQDVATCQIVLSNVALVPADGLENGTPIPGADDDYDRPGFKTYNRGLDPANRWGYTASPAWRDMFVPDRLVRTYEGYGIDPTVHPSHDANLVPSGVWLIDKVTYDTNGDIILDMRDVGRVLLDQICFPPVVPLAEYPLEWDVIRSEFITARAPQGGSWVDVTKSAKGGELAGFVVGSASSSNELYIGKGLTNEPMDSYVGPGGAVNNHHPDHALTNFDGPEYWWSTGQDTAKSKVWWQVDLDSPVNLAALRIHPHGGPYRIYISLKGPNGWIGAKKIPYTVTTGGVDIKADIPFVYSVLADKKNAFDAVLKRRYKDIKAIRLTFAQLQDMGVGEHPFHAGLRDVRLYTAANVTDLSFGEGDVMKVIGNYRDYTDIIKWVCAWGGFFWPADHTGMDFVQCSNNSDPAERVFFHYATQDSVLPKGRVWGDLMQSGEWGLATLTTELFDKRPLMDVINYVRDALGFLFFIDETGGVIWRMPNIWKKGNYLSPANLGQHVRTRTAQFVTIDEEQTLLDYQTVLDSRNIRERIFVANVTGKYGTVIKGFNPYPTGLRRIGGWTDQRFADKYETRIMADLVASKQMFTYKVGRVSIPGYPRIQVDDQVQIIERVTSETYFHYVMAISCDLDMEAGTWIYDLETHWLGEDPAGNWAVDSTELDGVTQAYLNAL